MMIPWTQKDGKVLEVKTSTGIVKVDPPIEIETLLKLQSKFETDELDAYMRLQIFIKDEINTDDLDGFIRVRSFLKGQTVNSGLKEIVKRYEPNSKSELVKTVSESSRTVSKYSADEVFALPENLRGPYSNIPKTAADTAYKCLSNGGKSPADIMGFPEFTYNAMVVTKLLQFWVSRGVVERIAKGIYKLSYPREILKNILVEKGVDITTIYVRESIWVPEEVAKTWLDKLTDDGILKKHGVNDTWNVVSKYTISSPPPLQSSSSEFGEFGAQVVKVKIPLPETFIEFREEFLCSSCNHHYVHGYKSGNFKLCGGCHQKNGGKTNNARGSMEHWRAGNEVKLSQD